MRRGILAARQLDALNDIADRLGVDLSRAAMPKSPDNEHANLHRLEAIRDAVMAYPDVGELEDRAAELEGELETAHNELEQRPTEADVVDRISAIKGIGPSTLDLIVDGLAETDSDEEEGG